MSALCSLLSALFSLACALWDLQRARAALADVEASSKKGGGLFSYITGGSQ